MAEKTIGLRLKIDGVNQTITTIKDLETAINTMREKLASVAIGSQEFKQLTGEIQRAETEVGKLRQQTEGIGFEKQLEGFGKFTGGITSGFAAATAAAQLFGENTEEVSKAATQAQNLLTVALGARGIAETVAGAKIVATTIATKAQAAANYVANLSFKSLYATMVANPIGAVLAVVGLLVTAMIALSEETKDVTKEQRELNKVVSDEAIKLNTLVGVLNNVNTSNEARLGAISELKKMYPGFNALLDDENKLNQEGIKWVQAKTQALILQGQINKVLEKIVENNTKKLEIQNRTVEESIGFWDKTRATFVSLFSAYGQLGAEIDKAQSAIENNKEETDKLDESNKRLETSLNDLLAQQQKNSSELITGNKLLDEQAEKEKKAADAAALREKQLQAAFANEKRRNELIRGELQRKLADLLLSYKQEKEAAIKNGEDLTLVTKTYNKRRLDTITQYEKDVAKVSQDYALKLNEITNNFYDIREKAQIKANENELYNYAKQLEELDKVAKKANKDLTLTPFKLIDEKGVEQQLMLTEESLKKINDLTLLRTTELNKQRAQLELDGLKLTYEQFSKQIYDNDENIAQERLNLQGVIYKKEFDIQAEANKIRLKNALEVSVKLGQLTQADLEETLKSYDIQIAKEKEAGLKRLELNTNFAEAEKILQENIRLQTEAYYEFANKARKEYNLTGERLSRELVLDNLMRERKILEATQNNINAKLKLLKDAGLTETDEYKQLSLEKLKIDEQYAAKSDEVAKTSADNQKKYREESIENLQKGIEIFSQTISQIGSLLSQSYSLQLEKLEIDYQNTLEQIVGDTEEANILREKEEIMYQNKKKAIEKKARVDSLKIQLAQAVADTASAVLKTYAEYGFSPVGIALGILAAGIGAVQVGLISQQIGVVNSMARGGFLRGPSHEQGGIKYQGGGVELEGNEAVINRRSTLQYAPLLSQINEQGGGKPIYVNSIMDSRMAEVLASTRNEPIRAYVLEQDITKSQAVNRRLEELASF